VNPIRSKYNPSVGDIVIGSVVEISNKRWKIDILSENEAFLHLNSTYLPE
jgi:exosome complex component RRP4